MKGKVVDKELNVLSWKEKSIVLLAGSQASPVCPSYRGSVVVKTTLRGKNRAFKPENKLYMYLPVRFTVVTYDRPCCL